MRYPALSNLSCAECQRHVYSIPECEPVTYDLEDGNGPQMTKRLEGEVPPCNQCPRGGPENEARTRLNSENEKALLMYYRSTAPGFVLPPSLVGCTLWSDVYHTIDGILNDDMRRVDSDRIADSVARQIARIF